VLHGSDHDPSLCLSSESVLSVFGTRAYCNFDRLPRIEITVSNLLCSGFLVLGNVSGSDLLFLLLLYLDFGWVSQFCNLLEFLVLLEVLSNWVEELIKGFFNPPL